MKTVKAQVPEGVRDVTGQEAFAKRALEQRLQTMFVRSGFEEIITPSLEYADLFEGEVGNLRQDRMIRLFEQDGKMMTLRPDFTMPAARVVSSRAKQSQQPIRVFYRGSAFGLEHDYGQQRREFSQVGAELMGDSGLSGDAEMLSLAAQSMTELGFADFVRDIGHVGIFQCLAKQAGFSEEETETLRGMLDEKNAMEAGAFLQQLGVLKEIQHQCLSLIELYGGVEVLDKAEEIFYQPCYQSVLKELRLLAVFLQQMGHGNSITIDLGLLPGFEYYNGLVFRGLGAGVGSPIISGGRYDGVLAQFGKPMQAVGFAINMEQAMAALKADNAWPAVPKTDLVVGAAEGCFARAVAFARAKRSEGLRVVLSYQTDKSKVLAQAENEGAQAVFLEESKGAEQ